VLDHALVCIKGLLFQQRTLYAHCQLAFQFAFLEIRVVVLIVDQLHYLLIFHFLPNVANDFGSENLKTCATLPFPRLSIIVFAHFSFSAKSLRE
jgi:hypothetical protein